MRRFLLMLALVGCGKADEPPAAAKRTDPAPAQTPAPAPGEAAPKPLKDLFGNKPSLPAPVAALRLGAKKEEAQRALPALFERKGLEPAGHPGVKIEPIVPGGDGPVTGVRVRLPAADARAALTAAWGEPTVARDSLQKEVFYWHDPEGGMRAKLEPSFKPELVDLEIDRYTPAKKLLGEEKGRFGFEGVPLLGATPEAIEAGYKEYLDDKNAQPDGITLRLLPTEYSGLTFVQLKIANGKVIQVHFTIPFDEHPPFHDDVLAAIKAKWGEASADDGLYKTYQKRPKIRVEDNKALNLFGFFVTP